MLHPLDRLLRVFAALLFAWVGVFVFVHPAGIAFAFALAVWFAGEAVTGRCPLRRRWAGGGDGPLGGEASFALALLGVQAALAYVWIHAGLEKITGDFASNLPQTFARFADKNPYPLYKAFLTGFATPNAAVFAQAVQWSQVLIGIALAGTAAYAAYGAARTRVPVGTLALLALLGGILMNANFWLAGAWTSPSTSTVNSFMFWVQLAVAYGWFEWMRKRVTASAPAR